MATATVLPLAPADVAAPTVTGTPTQGERLTAGPGTWSGGAAAISYRWEDCDALGQSCLYISGAAASSYVLAGTDVGDTVRVVATATNAAGSASASSEASAVVTAVQSTGRSSAARRSSPAPTRLRPEPPKRSSTPRRRAGW